MANLPLIENPVLLPLFPEHKLGKLDPTLIPKHVAIIPDGNRRWAKKMECSTHIGHEKGCDVVIDIVDAAKLLGVKVLTIFSFSTENWTRAKIEVDILMHLLETFLVKEREKMVKNNIRLQTIGNLDPLPHSVKTELQKSIDATKDSTGIDFVLALNYGAKDELTRTFRTLARKVKDGHLTPETITQETIEAHLDTSEWPMPDLLIRTAGERRISNFLLWQLAYAELYLTQEMWPEFTPELFLDALLDYQQRERRIGK